MKDIQRIVDEERAKSKLSTLTDHQVNCTIAANNRTPDHYNGSMTDPVVRKAIEPKRKEGVARAKAAGKFTAAQIKRYKDPAQRELTGAKASEVWADPDRNQNLLIAVQNRWDEPTRAKASAGHIKQWEDTAKREKQSATMAALRQYPLITPLGVFANTLLAGEAHNISRDMIGYRRKTKPTEYYYITLEEYKKLTGE